MSEFRPVITSLADHDVYKETMWQAMLHRNPGTQAVYRFVCRNRPDFPLATLVAEVNEQLDHLCTLRYTESELDYRYALRYMKSDFVDFLRLFQFQRRFITARAVGDDLEVVANGPQVHVMAFEIFVLEIVNELYFRQFTNPVLMRQGENRLNVKIDSLQDQLADIHGMAHPFEFFDFGSRRRFSKAWHRQVVKTLAARLPDHFRGTSNFALAQELGITAFGTFGHEWLQTYQALPYQLRLSQRAALEDWVMEYRGDLGIALTDVIGMDAFLADFDAYYASLFTGMRHDSGDPIVWGEKAIAHYEKLRIDPHSKRLVFSDGLTTNKAVELYRHFGNRVQTGFGIGTSLTNDLGPTPLNIVMKLSEVNGQPVAKLSDSPGKTLCQDETFLAYLRQVFKVVA